MQWRPCLASALARQGGEERALTLRKNVLCAAVPGCGAGVTDAMRAAGAGSLVQVLCTELVAVHRLLRAATVRGGRSAR